MLTAMRMGRLTPGSDTTGYRKSRPKSNSPSSGRHESNPSIERTSSSKLRLLEDAPHGAVISGSSFGGSAMLRRLVVLVSILLGGPLAQAKPPAEWQFKEWRDA